MLRKIKLLATALFIMLCQATFASHFLGYDMQLVNIKDANNNPTDTYKWRLKFYRDVTGAGIPTSFSFTVFKANDNASAGNFTVTKINPQTIISYPANYCVPAQAQLRVELGIYESPVINYSALNNVAGYYATGSLCCRNTGIVNLQGESSSYSGLMVVYFPRLNVGPFTRYNSSPSFAEIPIAGFSVGKQYDINWAASDPDGDSLVYSMALPLDGGPTAPSFQSIQYAANYSLATNIADGNPDFRINPSTGIITFKPTIANKYLVAIKVEEYRKFGGIAYKIGEVRREMQIESFISTDLPPVLYDSLANTKVYDTIDVRNVQNIQTKVLNFVSADQANDSVYIKIIPEISSSSNNILDTNLIDATWADILGNTKVGIDAQNYIIRGLANARAFLTIKADSNNASTVPFKFKIVSFDNTCFVPLTDTVHYELLIRGNVCYNSVQSVTYACDSFIFNGTTYYQSLVFTDTVKSSVGCDVINITNVNLELKPLKPIITGNLNVTDTSQIYTYSVDSQANVLYSWGGSAFTNATNISGANSATLTLKWNTVNAQESIDCYIYRGLCFDSTFIIINVTNAVGLNNIALNKINVYPNPVSNVLTFDIKNNLEHANISIYNTLGQLLQQSTLHNNELNVAGLPEGVYQFVLSKGTQQFRGTFIKE